MFNTLKTELLFFKAQFLAKRKRLDKSIAVYEAALNARPSCSGLRLQLGLTLFRNSEYERALEEIDRAREIDPSNPAIPMFSGIILLELEKYEEALEVLEASLGLNAGNELCLSLKGVALARLGRVSEGAEILEKNFFHGNDWLDFFILTYCESLCAEKDVDSLGIFENSMAGPSDRGVNGYLNFFLSGLERALDEIEYRIQLLKLKLKRTASKEEDVFLRGILSGLRLFSLDRMDEAKAEFRKCAEMDYAPGADKKHELCVYLYNVEEFECLERLLERYYEDDSEDAPETAILKAETAMHMKKFEEARRLIDEYEKDAPPDAWCDYLKGVCGARTGHMEEAESSFKNAVARSKRSINKSYLTECLEQCRTF